MSDPKRNSDDAVRRSLLKKGAAAIAALGIAPPFAAVFSHAADISPAAQSAAVTRNEGKTVLVVGATGSIGRHVVPEAVRQGYKVRALVRNPSRATWDSSVAQNFVGDLTKPETLEAAVDDVDAVIFVHGTHFRDTNEGKDVDYGGVLNVLKALNGRRAHITYMTAVGITNHGRGSAAMQETVKWKRRAERLIRASGLSYTIVRPGWFDYNQPDQQKLVLRQGDTRISGSPADGVIARSQLAEVLVNSIANQAAWRKTVELEAERGGKTTDFVALWQPVQADTGMDGVRDRDNLPLAQEPDSFKADLEAVAKEFGSR